MKYQAKVYVTLKKSILDPQGRTVEHNLHRAGHSSITGVRIGKYIELSLEGELATVEAELKEIAETILSNPIMEDVRYALEEVSVTV